MSSHRLFTVVWKRQTRTRTFISSQICFSSLLQRRANSKYRSNDEPLDIVVNAVTETSSWFLTASFSNTLQLLRYFSFRCVFTRCSRSCLNGAASQYQSDKNKDELRSSEKSLTSRQRSKDKPLMAVAFTHSDQIRSQLLLKSWNYR